MPDHDHSPGRLRGHLRRHGLAYAALTVALSFSPVPSMAADLVTTDEIANGAVTAPKLAGGSVFSSAVADESLKSEDIKNGNVTFEDLGTSARGAKVYRYDLGSFNFAGGGILTVQLPGTWDDAKVSTSAWSAVLNYGTCACYYAIPGRGFGGQTDYRVLVTADGVAQIDGLGAGEAYTNVQIFRTVATTSPNVVPATARRSVGSVER